MTNNTHQTAPTQLVEAGGIRFAYRRFGKGGGLPLVFNQHYTGTMDYWDPLVTDGGSEDLQRPIRRRADSLSGCQPRFAISISATLRGAGESISELGPANAERQPAPAVVSGTAAGRGRR